MAVPLPPAELQFCDANGVPYAGGTLATYVPGTTTNKTTWKDAAGAVPNTNPIVLDMAGRCIVWGDGSYRTVLRDVDGNLVFDQTTETQVISAMQPVVTASDLQTARAAMGITGPNVPYTPPWTGALLTRPVSGPLTEGRVSATDFPGVDPTGVADSTAGLQLWLNAVVAGSGAGRLPAGWYKTSAPLVVNNAAANLDIAGDGWWQTRIVSASATADILDITTAWAVRIHDICLTCSATRSAGNHIKSATTATFEAHHVVVDNYACGWLSLDGSCATWRDSWFMQPANTSSIGMNIAGNAPGTITVSNVQWLQPTVKPYAGILITAAACVVLSNIGMSAHGTDLFIQPGAGQVVSTVYAVNCFFDGSGRAATANEGIYIAPAGTGVVQAVWLVNCWMCGHSPGSGVRSTPAGTARVQSLHLINCIAAGNAAYGLTVDGPTTDTQVIGGAFGGNTGGAIIFGAGVSDFSVTNARIGPVLSYGANSFAVTVAAGASDHYVIANNRISGNTAGITDGGTGVNKYVANNV